MDQTPASSTPGIIHMPPSQSQATPVTAPKVSQPKRPPSPYFKRIFEGRLNRQNYSAGSLLLLGVPLFCFIIFFGSFFSASGAMSWLLINPYDTEQLHNSAIKVEQLEQTVSELQNSPVNQAAFILLTLYILVTLPLNIGLQIRRLHDMNNSGWWLLLNIIPFVGYLFPFYVTFFSGTEGDNKYGPKPLPRVDIKNDILQISS